MHNKIFFLLSIAVILTTGSCNIVSSKPGTVSNVTANSLVPKKVVTEVSNPSRKAGAPASCCVKIPSRFASRGLVVKAVDTLSALKPLQ